MRDTIRQVTLIERPGRLLHLELLMFVNELLCGSGRIVPNPRWLPPGHVMQVSHDAIRGDDVRAH
jgi:hypothetical protein